MINKYSQGRHSNLHERKNNFNFNNHPHNDLEPPLSNNPNNRGRRFNSPPPPPPHKPHKYDTPPPNMKRGFRDERG